MTTTASAGTKTSALPPRHRLFRISAHPYLGSEKLIAIATPIVAVAMWELLSRTGVFDARILPPPSEVAAETYRMLLHDGLANDLRASIIRFTSGLLIGASLGTAVGLTMGLVRWFRSAMYPLVKLFYPMPHIALFPLILILVGLNERSNLIMVALGPFFTMLLSAAAAVQNIPSIYLKVATSFRETFIGRYRRVVTPAVFPPLVGSLRVALGQALVGAVAVEFLTGSEGLGNVIWHSWQILSMKGSMAGLICVAIVGLTAFLILDLFERWLIPWRPTEKN